MTTLFSASISRSGGEDSRGRSSAPPLAAEKERVKKKLLSFSDDSTFSSLGLCEWICQSTSMMVLLTMSSPSRLPTVYSDSIIGV